MLPVNGDNNCWLAAPDKIRNMLRNESAKCWNPNIIKITTQKVAAKAKNLKQVVTTENVLGTNNLTVSNNTNSLY